MTAPSRTAQFTRLNKILKKHYAPVAPDPNRSVLEHLVFASLLENAHFAAAEEAFAALVHTFYDWNEIRVSSIRELSEVVPGLPEPAAAAHRAKRVLQSVFEATYSFDLEDLRKQNLGPAVEKLEKTNGTTRFSVAYVVQAALGGHAIPIDSGTLAVLLLVALVAQQDAAAGVVPGLERAISKNAGIEFGSLLHQLGADYVAGRYSPPLHGILLEIDPSVKDRLPRRREAKPAVSRDAAAAAGASSGSQGTKAHRRPAGKEQTKEAAREAGGKPPSEAAAAAKEVASPPKKKPAGGKKSPLTAGPAEQEDAAPSVHVASAEPKPAEEKDAAAKRKPPAPVKKSPSKKNPEGPKIRNSPDAGRQESATEGLSKRKPR